MKPLQTINQTTNLSFSLWHTCYAVLKRDLQLAVSERQKTYNVVAFFLLICALFPLGVGPSTTVLSTLAAAVIWIAALFSLLLSLDGLFHADLQDGTLEQMFFNPYPMPLLILVKVIAHWLETGLFLLFLAPVLAIMLALPESSYLPLLLGLLLGTPTLNLIGAIGSAITAGMSKGNILLPIIVLPLYIPVLILGTGAVQMANNGLPYLPYLLWLGVLLILALILAPFATAAALRVSIACF